jgi:hypothetical protein
MVYRYPHWIKSCLPENGNARSIPIIALIEWNITPFQKCSIFISETNRL